MDHIKNKIIVISAGASGIGGEIAKSLSENGASVIVGDKDEVALKRLENDHPEIRTNQVGKSSLRLFYLVLNQAPRVPI